MDLELYTTPEAFAVARTWQAVLHDVVDDDVMTAMDSALDPVLAVVLAGILVAGTSAAVQITRWLITTATAATRVRVSEVQAPEFDPQSSSWSTSTVEHGFRHLVRSVSKFVPAALVERTVSYGWSQTPRTSCQVRSVVRGHVN